MPTKNFKHITQKGRFELKKLANSDGKGASFNGGAFGCGIACAAMLAGTKFERAIISLIEDGMDIEWINFILNKSGVQVQSKYTLITRNKFKGKGSKSRFLDKVINKLENSDYSMLIGTEEHWLLYDVGDGMIKDPDCSKPVTIDSFINGYSDYKKFWFYQIS